MRKANIVASVILILLCGCLFTQVNAIKQTGLEVIGPKIFPMAVLCLIMVLSLVVVITTMKSKEEFDEKFVTKAQGLRSLVTFLLVILYITGLQYIGFGIATILFLFVLTSFFYGKIDKGLVKLAIFAIIATILIFFLFNNFFGIILP